MKLNVWQWVGLVLLVLGIGLYVYEKYGTTAPAGPAATQPAK